MDAFIRTLPGVFEAIEASVEVRDAFVFAAWRNVAGEQIFTRTVPLLVEGKCLVIAVADNTWKRNLETLASQLLFRLNVALDKAIIDFIEFRVSGNDFVPSVSKVEEMDERLPAPVEIAVSAQSIRNEELRSTVLNAAANCLARQK
ncbi:MAG: DciA family protein [Pyrinomonadaceae bacterium]